MLAPDAYLHITFLLSLSNSASLAVPVSPSVGSGDLKLTREQAEDAFYMRDKLGQLIFRGDDYQLLYSVENSRQRCQKLFLAMECRPHAGAPVAYTWRGQFTCNEVTDWDSDRCTCSVTPTPADGYQELLESWDRPYNLLKAQTATNLRTITAQLDSLPTGVNLDFKRINTDQEGDFIGDDGAWAKFLTNTSYIGGGNREHETLLFRYRLVGIPMEIDPESGEYEAQDLSNQGWQFFDRNDTVSPPTADYVKSPEIAGFKPYTIGTFHEWWHTEGGRRPRYGTQLLLLPCGATPSQYGFSDAGYIQVTGPDPYKANNKEGTGTCLNLRRNLRNDNFKSLWWKFGQFTFKRCFPLLDGLYYLLSQTAPGLLPPSPKDLSDFYTNPTNPATLASGVNNEVPGLLIAAGSDIKRYFGSEPATRVPVSLKQFVEDLQALHDVGWFMDPATGWFRIEHRSYFESQQNGLVLDLTKLGPYAETAIVPAAYSYLKEQLPQYEQLQISSAVTLDFEKNIFFNEGEIEYSGACVNTREGQNTTTRNAQRLTGDVAGLVLSGDALPDSCIAVLAVNGDTIKDGNRPVAASELLRRYHRYGRVRPTGTINGVQHTFSSTRLPREQTGISAHLCSLGLISLPTQVYTQLSKQGRIPKAELNLRSGLVTLTVRHPAPESDAEGPLLKARQFDDSFNLSFR